MYIEKLCTRHGMSPGSNGHMFACTDWIEVQAFGLLINMKTTTWWFISGRYKLYIPNNYLVANCPFLYKMVTYIFKQFLIDIILIYSNVIIAIFLKWNSSHSTQIRLISSLIKNNDAWNMLINCVYTPRLTAYRLFLLINYHWNIYI